MRNLIERKCIFLIENESIVETGTIIRVGHLLDRHAVLVRLDKPRFYKNIWFPGYQIDSNIIIEEN